MMPLLIHHTARRGDYRYPPNSLPALEACVRAGARVIEIDIVPLREADFLVAHDETLESFSTGTGEGAALGPRDVLDYRLTHRGEPTPYRPMLLSEALALIAREAAPAELQLDLKEHAPLNDEVLRRLLRLVEPVRDRVRVTSCADWAIRRLHALDPELPLGFDPLFYLDARDPVKRDPRSVPDYLGAYGYWDDHPLARRRDGPAAGYLRARAEMLWTQAPPGCVWYIRARLLDQALGDGFDWIAAWHDRGAEVDAWTLDPERDGHLAMARRLIDAGVDRITTNDPVGLARALGGGARV